MSKIHVVPLTGEIGICSAKKKPCPYSDTPGNHFDTFNEAKTYSEMLMKEKYGAKVNTNAGKLIILVGLPGSGKSTIANAIHQENPKALINNRDRLRSNLFGEEYHKGAPDKKSEETISRIIQAKMLKTLRAGGMVIDDNTNTNPYRLSELVKAAESVGAEVEIRKIDVPIEVAKERNRARGEAGGRLVPEYVIDRMAKNLYDSDGSLKDVLHARGNVFFVEKNTPGMETIAEFNKELEQEHPILGKDVAIVDLDGTLVSNQEAVDRYLNPNNTKTGKKDYARFNKASADAPVNTKVLSMLRRLRESGVTVFALTGRQDGFAPETIDFLKRSGAPVSRLIMARQGDARGDYYTKNDAASQIAREGFRIIHAIDDRPSSIQVWREKDITVSRVHSTAPGEILDSYKEPEVDDKVGSGVCIVCQKDIPVGEVLHEDCRTR